MRLVDWDLAASTAIRLVPPGPRMELADAVAVVDELRDLVAEADAHVRAYTGLDAVPESGTVAVVDRPGWVRANVDGFSNLVDPLLDTVVTKQMSSVMTAVGSRATGVEVGTLLAYMASRVLGQWEPFGAQLTLVAPNIVAAERALDAPVRDFRLWVCLHEVTHRTQFAAAPWLSEHVRSLLADYLAAADLDPFALIGRLAGAVRARETPSIVEIVQTPEQQQVLDRVTGVMSLLEGHADVVMDGVGPDVVPSVAMLRARFEQRRQSTRGVDRIVRRLLGLEMKMRQYAEGARFVRAVRDAVGIEGLNRVWTSAAMLPDRAEILDPARWIERTGGGLPAVSA